MVGEQFVKVVLSDPEGVSVLSGPGAIDMRLAVEERPDSDIFARADSQRGFGSTVQDD
jgi:hypothetical protein